MKMRDFLVAYGDEPILAGGISRAAYVKLERAALGGGSGGSFRAAPLVSDTDAMKWALENEPFGTECRYLGARLLVIDAVAAITYASHPKRCLFLNDPYQQLAAVSAVSEVPLDQLYTRLHQSISFSARTNAGELNTLVSLTRKHSQYIHFTPLSPHVPRGQRTSDHAPILLTIGERCVPPLTHLFSALAVRLPDIPILVQGHQSFRSDVEQVQSSDVRFRWVQEADSIEVLGASVHIHCGQGRIDGVGGRFLDSWSLKRPIIQFIDPTFEDSKLFPGVPASDQIVQDGRTGLLCRSSQEVISQLRHLSADRSFSDLVADRAHSLMIAGNDTWRTVIENLV